MNTHLSISFSTSAPVPLECSWKSNREWASAHRVGDQDGVPDSKFGSGGPLSMFRNVWSETVPRGRCPWIYVSKGKEDRHWGETRRVPVDWLIPWALATARPQSIPRVTHAGVRESQGFEPSLLSHHPSHKPGVAWEVKQPRRKGSPSGTGDAQGEHSVTEPSRLLRSFSFTLSLPLSLSNNYPKITS